MDGFLKLRGRLAPTTTLAVLALLLLSTSGCGGNPAELETAHVSGTVTLDGKPLTVGEVLFVPRRGRGSQGALGADGSFTMSTYGDGDGAIIGPNKVAIDASRPKPGETSKYPDADWFAPRRYANPNTSGLHFEVRAGENNVANFELSSQ